MKTPISTYEREVLAQPAALARVLAAYSGKHSPLQRLGRSSLIARPSSLVFLGMGSSLYAAHPAVCYLASRGIRAQALDASEYLYYLRKPYANALHVLISQSGESPEVKKIAAQLGKRPYIAITNDSHSSLAKSAPINLPILGGKEKGTTNQTHTNTIIVTLALAAWAAGQNPAAVLRPARRIPAAMTQLLKNWRAKSEPLVDYLGMPEHLDLVGRGPSLGIVWQCALILRELCHLKIAGHTAVQFRHGLIPSMHHGGALIALAPRGPTRSLVLRLADEAVAHRANVLVLTDANIRSTPTRRVLRLPSVPELFAPLLSIVPLELLGILWAERRSMDPGEGIAKITKLE